MGNMLSLQHVHEADPCLQVHRTPIGYDVLLAQQLSPAPCRHISQGVHGATTSARCGPVSMHTHTHTGTATRRDRKAGMSLHILSCTHTSTLGGVLAKPGPMVPILMAEECRQLRMLCQGREGEAKGKPHRQESGQACQAEAGPLSARNCAGLGTRADICLLQSPPSSRMCLELLRLGRAKGLRNHRLPSVAECSTCLLHCARWQVYTSLTQASLLFSFFHWTHPASEGPYCTVFLIGDLEKTIIRDQCQEDDCHRLGSKGKMKVMCTSSLFGCSLVVGQQPPCASTNSCQREPAVSYDCEVRSAEESQSWPAAEHSVSPHC